MQRKVLIPSPSVIARAAALGLVASQAFNGCSSAPQGQAAGAPSSSSSAEVHFLAGAPAMPLSSGALSSSATAPSQCADSSATPEHAEPRAP